MNTQQIKQIEEIISAITEDMNRLEAHALHLEEEPLMFNFVGDTRLCGISRRLRHATETLKAMSTGVDIAPLAPQATQLDIPAFLQLVRRRRVLIQTSDQDTYRVDIDDTEKGNTIIDWYDDGEVVELRVRPDDAFVSEGETFTIHNVTFIIEQL